MIEWLIDNLCLIALICVFAAVTAWGLVRGSRHDDCTRLGGENE